jgi:hypothetical protein
MLDNETKKGLLYGVTLAASIWLLPTRAFCSMTLEKMMDFKVGIYEDLDYPTYDSIPAWRSHDLSAIAKCPFTWKNQVFNNSPALLEGRVQHTAFLGAPQVL